MNATIPMLLVATVAIAFAPRTLAQDTDPPERGSRRPVDVSAEGLGGATPGAPGDMAPRGSIGFSVRPSPGGLDTPLDCLERIADQATGGCLTASSRPTLGVLFPYPGDGNVFVPSAFVGGGEGNVARGVRATIAGGWSNTANSLEATVGGGGSNAAGGLRSTIGGGESNVAAGSGSTVGGGVGNASGNYATVAGGRDNTASGRYTMVGGGTENIAFGDLATVGGGLRNTASGFFSTVGGGLNNAAQAHRSTIPGGERNTAQGHYSFAAGRRAKADHDGAFVWGDSVDADKPSSTADQFNVYCSGGARFFSNSAASTGVLLAAGGGTWTMVSDREAKKNIEPVDARAVLDRVAELPVATWSYRDQDDSIRHMGPMAQDFYAAFGLGLGEKTIDTIDPNGVALAAIQGLNAELEERLGEKDAEIEELRARVGRLEALARAALAKEAAPRRF